MAIPHICHRHHRRCLCKFFLPGVIFFQIEREKLVFYCIVYNNLRPFFYSLWNLPILRVFITFRLAFCHLRKHFIFILGGTKKIWKILFFINPPLSPSPFLIPHICHRHHRRCLYKFFLPGVIFFQIEREKLAFYCIVYNNLRPSV